MANIDLSGIIKEAVEANEEKRLEIFQNHALEYRQNITQVMDSLIWYHDQNAKKNGVSLFGTNAQVIVQTVQSANGASQNLSTEALQTLQKHNVDDKEYMIAMKQGYYLLNQIGELIRGEPVTYTIVAKSAEAEGYAYIEGLSIEDILGDINSAEINGLVTIGKHGQAWSANEAGKLGRQLKLSGSAVKELQNNHTFKQIDNETYDAIQNIVLEKNEIDPLTGKNKIITHNKGINAEAVMRTIYNPETLNDEKEVPYIINNDSKNLAANLIASMGNDTFWTSGDIVFAEDAHMRHVQVKSEGASFTNVSQLIYRLNHVQQLLDRIINNGSKLAIYSNEKQVNVANDVAQATIDNAIKKMFTKFG